MELIDTHAHLYHQVYAKEVDALRKRSQAAGVHKIYMPNLNKASIGPMLALAKQAPGLLYPMLGLHPCEVKEHYGPQLQAIKDHFGTHSFVAVGEIGLDRYHATSTYRWQLEALKVQLGWALERKLPVVLHGREAIPEMIRLLKAPPYTAIKGVFHCFTGSFEEAKAVIKMGFLIGIGGLVTYPKSTMASLVAQLDLCHLVLETDAPYLAPHPFRGQRNEPAYLKYIAHQVAQLSGRSVEEVARITTANAQRLFERT